MVEFRTEIVVQEILEANYMWWGIKSNKPWR